MRPAGEDGVDGVRKARRRRVRLDPGLLQELSGSAGLETLAVLQMASGQRVVSQPKLALPAMNAQFHFQLPHIFFFSDCYEPAAGGGRGAGAAGRLR
jgi:hypothetical protein